MVIIAGANGSGQTSFGIPYVEELGYEYLNADEIAKSLEDNGEEVQ
jgi:predicted ABC-type ATPase